MAGKFLANKLTSQGNIIMLAGRAGASVVMMHAQGVKEELKKYPKMKIIAEQFSEITRADGMRRSWRICFRPTVSRPMEFTVLVSIFP
jgi:ABC-type sugar transport system substrate-binding protein